MFYPLPPEPLPPHDPTDTAAIARYRDRMARHSIERQAKKEAMAFLAAIHIVAGCLLLALFMWVLYELYGWVGVASVAGAATALYGAAKLVQRWLLSVPPKLQPSPAEPLPASDAE